MNSKIKLVTIQSNFYRVEFKNIDLYFSYETIIAFGKDGYITASENMAGSTTGKHLNLISEKKNRLPREKFLDLLNKEVLLWLI